ncbi:MAG: SRPBCC family protein, partial [Burkholderiales bacterium]
PAAGGRGTEVRVELEYRPPAGSMGRTVARLFGEEPRQQVNDDRRRFKQVMETGEIVRSDGSPDGVGLRQQVMQRPARPVDGRALARAGSMTGRRPAGS